MLAGVTGKKEEVFFLCFLPYTIEHIHSVPIGFVRHVVFYWEDFELETLVIALAR